MGIKIVGEDKTPRIICQHCKQQIPIDISAFAKDCTKILRDSCPKCKGEIFVGILILSHKSHYNLLQSIKLVVNNLQSDNQLLI